MGNTVARTVLFGTAVMAVGVMIRKLHRKACIANVPPAVARKLADENRHNPDFVIIDVRTLPEYMDGHVDTALPVDFHSPTFMDEVNKLDKTKTYLVYSGHGGRSRKAAHVMRRLGFRRVRMLAGGYHAWREHAA